MYPIRFVIMIPVACLAILTGCSSSIKKADLPANANPQTEFSQLEQEMSQAQLDNIDIASPQAYTKAQKSFEDAKDMLANDKPREKILDKIAVAKGALQEARARAPQTKDQLSDVLRARQEARSAKAEEYYKIQMAAIDRNLADITWDYEKGHGTISPKRRQAIIQSYLDLESKSLQRTYLGDARSPGHCTRTRLPGGLSRLRGHLG